MARCLETATETVSALDPVWAATLHEACLLAVDRAPSSFLASVGTKHQSVSPAFFVGIWQSRNGLTVSAEQIDQWFKHLANWEQTLEEMAAASTDQNFTEELGAIESCMLAFGVCSEGL